MVGGDFCREVECRDFFRRAVGGSEDGEGVEWGLEENIRGTKSERGWIERGLLGRAGGGGKEKNVEERNRRGHRPPPSQRQDWDCCWQMKASRGQEERVIEGQEEPQGRSA